MISASVTPKEYFVVVVRFLHQWTTKETTYQGPAISLLSTPLLNFGSHEESC